MKALVIESYGGPGALAIRTFPDATPAEGQIIVKVQAGGINFADVLTSKGGYPGTPKPPLIAGREFAGTELASGRRVMGYAQWGAFAERMAARPELLWPIPDTWSFEHAAAFPVNDST